MNLEINEQLANYLSAQGKVVLNACPGSGKTTAVAKKLMDFESKYGGFVGIACLSFTNTAKDEIQEKYKELSGTTLKFPHKISTIDSFINQYITLPYYYLLDRDFKRPKIIESSKFMDDLHPLKNIRLKGLNGKPLCFSYPPSSIRIEKDNSYSSNGKQPSEEKVDLKIFNKYCADIKLWQFKKGLITTGDSAFIALYLLNKNPKIGEWLCRRFPHIIVDEAQDNSEIQHAIFDKLIGCGLQNIEFVGDPYQSLYEWRDAKPQLFTDKYQDATNWQGLDLTDNRRSPQKIIDCFSSIRKGSDPKINSKCGEDRKLSILIYKYTDDNISDIISHFDKHCADKQLYKNQVVVRGNSFKNRILGKESDYKPWNSQLPNDLIECKSLFLSKEVKKAINKLRFVAVSLLNPNIEMQELKTLENDLRSDYSFNAVLLQLLHDIPNFETTISEWVDKTKLILKDSLSLDYLPDFKPRKRNSPTFDKAILDDPLIKHFKIPQSNQKTPVTTVHQVKGKSLDGILIFFDKKSHKGSITFKDICNDGTFPSEKQRIIYVAMSRPRHLLAMAFHVDVTDESLRLKFGNDIQIIAPETLEDIPE